MAPPKIIKAGFEIFIFETKHFSLDEIFVAKRGLGKVYKTNLNLKQLRKAFCGRNISQVKLTAKIPDMALVFHTGMRPMYKRIR